LRQFISARRLLRALGSVKSGIEYSWTEVRACSACTRICTRTLHRPPTRPVTVLLIGAGDRGSIYADFALKNPKEMKIVGVADANAQRVQRIAYAHNVPARHCWGHWESVFGMPRLADAVIIATPDRLHTAPCLRARWRWATTCCWKAHRPHRGRMPADLLALRRPAGASSACATCCATRLFPRTQAR
jgi:hypothetical protein